MKFNIFTVALLVGALSILIGLIGRIFGVNLYFTNATWHMFAQTCFLFAIAWKLGEKPSA